MQRPLLSKKEVGGCSYITEPTKARLRGRKGRVQEVWPRLSAFSNERGL